MSYYNGLKATPLLYEGQNIDLIVLRNQIALDGYKKGILDVYGKGWPKGIAKEDLRDGNWGASKQGVLNRYSFNLCFENTAAFNYMTEKIWDSIQNYCLPIYYGRNTNAYEIFPRNSFIDYTDFKSPEELFNFVESISSEEFITRMNKCLKVYNDISNRGKTLIKQERIKTLDEIVKKLHSI